MASAMSGQMHHRPGAPVDLTLFINGEKHTVYDKYPATTSLNDYIRDVAGLKGTKVMCNEAGCGCCAVTVTHGAGGDKLETFSINSCLCPLYSTDGWQISTVEGIGSQKEGFHPIQEQVAKYNATQCGYCTPGFVMSMYGLLHQNPQLSQQEIEDSFDGHICRCTGYRPILDAMKTFAADSNAPDAKTIDIEDLNKKLCSKTGEPCKGTCGNKEKALKVDLFDSKWHRPTSLKELSALVKENKNASIKFLFGNTASGIFKNEGPYDVYVDLHGISELYRLTKGSNSVVFGASTTLTKLKDHLIGLQGKPGFAYCERVVKHLKVLASVLVRNAGCIAGNFMIKHGHPDFPSDLFTMMEAIGASLSIYDLIKGKESKHSLEEFLRKVDMKNKVITALEMPAFAEGTKYRSFKITPRSQNAHAYVNAAFKIPMDAQNKISKQPSIVFGGVGLMTHAVKTEKFLTGKKLDYALIKESVKVLSQELQPTADSPLSASPEYRRNLSTNLLYKTLLEVCPNVDGRLASGANNLERPLSQALHTFQERPKEFPLKQPLPKKTAPLQASGEAVYTNDMPSFRRELYGAFVMSTVPSGTIQNVDPSPALRIPGVVRYVGVNDIPEGGVNNFMANPLIPVAAEEIFASSEVNYVGQIIGVILAESETIAKEGSKKVKVTYKDAAQRGLIDVKEGAEKKALHNEPTTHVLAQPDEALKNAHKVIEGEVREGSQYYFFLETHVAIAVPTEDGLDVYSATQFLDQLQMVCSLFMAKPFNFFNMMTPRVGGSFGGKALVAATVGAATALCAYVTGRPVRMVVDMSSCMQAFASRHPILAKYKAGISSEGKIEAIDADLYIDNGIKPSPLVLEFSHSVDQGYYVPNWRVTCNMVKTNRPTAQAVRGPGSVPAALVMETIMEHAAKEMNMHPIELKGKNLYQKGQTDFMGEKLDECTLQDMWHQLKQKGDVEPRMKDVDTFNRNNTWKKRAITMTAVKYAITYFPPGHTTHVSIFAGDGTVTVMTTGVESGQGLYMKVAQAVAATLGIPVDDVKVRPNQNNVTPNPGCTGGSSTSEICVDSAISACNELKERMRPLKEKMPEADWKGLLKACYFSSIELSASSRDTTVKQGQKAYHTYCVGAAETEVDILTGEYQIRRVDMMCDFGDSLNPTIDIGQAEGAYVMGLGAYLTEELIYDNLGTVLNDGSWEYKPPTTKDIPIDWRVHLLADSPNPKGVLSSKAVGEPPIGLSVGSMLAIKAAVESARQELTGNTDFIPVVAPFTVERIQLSTGANTATATI